MIALYAGSFDPFTNGHLDIVRRAAALYDEVVVAVGDNEAKTYEYSKLRRVDMTRMACMEFKNVKVVGYSGLMLEVAEKHNAKVLLRGIRSDEDREYEMGLADIHRMWNPEIETLIMFPDPSVAKISSTFVKKVAEYEGAEVRLRKMLPLPVLTQLQNATERALPTPLNNVKCAFYDAMSFFP